MTRTFLASRSRLLAILALAGSLWAAQAGAEPLKIGAVLPLSGNVAEVGEIMAQGANLAVEHVNADKMLSGPLSIAYEDSQGSPQRAVLAMTKLSNVDRVPFVLTAMTGVTKALSPIANKNKVVAINGGGVGPDLALLGDYLWNVIPLANQEAQAMVPYLVKARNFKKVALVYVDDPVGEGIRTELERTVKAAGGELVVSLSIPSTASQFASVAAKLRGTKADLVYLASYGVQMGQIIKQLRDNGVTTQFASYSGLNVPPVLVLPEAEGALFTSQPIKVDASDPVTSRFVNDFKKKYHKDPAPYHVNYYNAVRLYALLAKELESKKLPLTGENLLKTRLAIPSFALVGGSVSFDKDGTAKSVVSIFEIKNKTGELVKNSP